MSNVNKYYVDEAEDGMGRCLVLNENWSDDLRSILDSENISVLRLSNSAGWKDDNISFLRNFPRLRGVEVYGWDVKDLTPLSSVKGLEYLGLQCNFTLAPDFSTFSNLSTCKVFWRPKARTILDCIGLKRLNVVNYPSESLCDLSKMVGLGRLQITSRRLISLAGIENLASLKVLDVAECYRLESLSGIQRCGQLHTVEFQNCKKINDVSSLGELAELRRLVLVDCGRIESLRALSNCQLLESLSFAGDTKVDDGDLACLLKIPNLSEIWFADRRHYSHKREELASLLPNG